MKWLKKFSCSWMEDNFHLELDRIGQTFFFSENLEEKHLHIICSKWACGNNNYILWTLEIQKLWGGGQILEIKFRGGNQRTRDLLPLVKKDLSLFKKSRRLWRIFHAGLLVYSYFQLLYGASYAWWAGTYTWWWLFVQNAMLFFLLQFECPTG